MAILLMYLAIFCACAVLSVGVLRLAYPVDIFATLAMAVIITIGADAVVGRLRRKL